MKVIKDNSNKKVKVKCTHCKSKIKVKINEFTKQYGCYFIVCPICKEHVYKK